MAMSKSKIIGGLVVLAAAGAGTYYYMNQVANDKMVEKVNAYLVENNLQDKLTWEKSEASVTGSGTFYNVTAVGDTPETSVKIKKLHITKIEKSEVALSFEGLSTMDGKSIFSTDKDLESMGYGADLPLLNGKFDGGYSKEANNSSFSLTLNQDQMADMEIDFKASETNTFIDMLNDKQKEVEANPSLLVGPLGPVKIDKLEVTFSDKGLLAKTAGGTGAVKLEDCQSSLAMLGVSDDSAGICKSVVAFTDGSKKTIALKANPSPAYPVINLMELGKSGMPDVNKLIKDLNLKVTN